MKVIFQVQQSIHQVITEIIKSENWDTIEIPTDQEDPTESIFRLEDRDFPSSFAVATIKSPWGDENEKSIEIVTAWSSFRYEIYEEDDKVWVDYKGSYLGLLAQNILPELTPVSILDAEIESSLMPFKHGITLKDYLPVRDKFVTFKQDVGLDKPQAHPKCIWEVIKPVSKRALAYAEAAYLRGERIEESTHALGGGDWSIEVHGERGFLFELVGANGTQPGEESADLNGELADIVHEAHEYAILRGWIVQYSEDTVSSVPSVPTRNTRRY